jgi:hypothetical protein
VLIFPAAALALRPWTQAGEVAPEDQPAKTTV